MKYPDWLPYPRYLLKTLLIFVETNLAFLGASFAFTITSFPAFVTSAADETGKTFGWWLAFWAIAIPVYVFAQCDRLTWHRPKNWAGLAWFPAWRSWFEGIFAYLTLAVCILTPSVMIVLGSDPRYYQPTEEEVAAVLIIAFIMTAYIYHIRGLLWTWWTTNIARLRPTPKAKAKKVASGKPLLSKPMSDIDRELEELKRQMRKNAKKAKPPGNGTGG